MLLHLLEVLAPVMVCAAVGYGWGRLGPAFDDATASRLVIYISAPCLIFHSLVTLSVSPEALTRMALLAASAIAAFALLGAAALKLLRLPLHTFLGPVTFTNCGNLGLGVCLFAFGEEGLALGVAYFAVSFVSHSLVGDVLFAGKTSLRPIVVSPLAWAAVISVVILKAEWKVPLALARVTELLGAPTIPVMLIALGVSLSRLRMRALGAAFAVALLRLGMGVGVGVALSELLALEGVMRGVLILECAMPAGVLNYLFAQKYNRDPQAVAGVVLVSTLLSFVAIPLLLSALLSG